MTAYRYLFGPVLSRRFGRSLGVDLTPLKTCPLDCVFCQLGRTPATAVRRAEYVPTADVLAELDDWLASGAQADRITLAGSGEPTLHTRFGDVLAHICRRTAIPTLLLSNGALMHLPEVRAAACLADAVKVSLSAWDQASFERLNRPDPNLRFEQLIEGERLLRAEFPGTLLVETMLVRGINDALADVRRIAAAVASLRPDRVHLNTVARPPGDPGARAVPARRLSALARLFTPPAEVASEPDSAAGQPAAADPVAAIRALLLRHPVTARQAARAGGLTDAAARAALRRLAAAGEAVAVRRGARVYYGPGNPDASNPNEKARP